MLNCSLNSLSSHHQNLRIGRSSNHSVQERCSTGGNSNKHTYTMKNRSPREVRSQRQEANSTKKSFIGLRKGEFKITIIFLKEEDKTSRIVNTHKFTIGTDEGSVCPHWWLVIPCEAIGVWNYNHRAVRAGDRQFQGQKPPSERKRQKNLYSKKQL